MVDARGAQAEQLGAAERAEADRPRRADDELGETLALDVIEHVEKGREAELLQLVLGNFEFADGREILDRDVGDRKLRARGDDGEVGARRGRAACTMARMVRATPLTSSSVSVNQARFSLRSGWGTVPVKRRATCVSSGRSGACWPKATT